MRTHKYCAFKSCDNNRENCELSFFTFPKETDRFNIWAVASGRSDLLHKDVKNHKNYLLCAFHFAPEMFTSDLRNRLEKHAVPIPIGEVRTNNESNSNQTLPESTVLLNEIPIAETETGPTMSTGEDQIIIEISPNDQIVILPPAMQISKPVKTTSVAQTQTSVRLTGNIFRKGKLQKALEKGRRKLKSSSTQTDSNNEIFQFYLLCDKFLPEGLANFVKSQVVKDPNKSKKGMRYPPEYKQFASSVYLSSPATYRSLLSSFMLPSVRTLQRIAKK